MADFHQSFAILKGESLFNLRILVDRSSVEAFAMNGRATVSLAVVPECSEAQFAQDGCKAGESNAGVSLFSAMGIVAENVTASAMGCGCNRLRFLTG